MGAGYQPLRHTRHAVQFVAERYARPGSPVPRRTRRIRPAAQVGVDLVDRLPHVVDRVYGHCPSVVHVEGTNERIRLGQAVRAAAALHIGLAREDPHIPHEHLLYRQPLAAYAQLDVIWSPCRYASDAAIELASCGPPHHCAGQTLHRLAAACHADDHLARCLACPLENGIADVASHPLQNHPIEQPCQNSHLEAPFIPAYREYLARMQIVPALRLQHTIGEERGNQVNVSTADHAGQRRA